MSVWWGIASHAIAGAEPLGAVVIHIDGRDVLRHAAGDAGCVHGCLILGFFDRVHLDCRVGEVPPAAR
jgi:hypothetical protein